MFFLLGNYIQINVTLNSLLLFSVCLTILQFAIKIYRRIEISHFANNPCFKSLYIQWLIVFGSTQDASVLMCLWAPIDMTIGGRR